MIDERLELFGQTLNDVFKQFQKLLDDYKELIEKSKESENNSSNVLSNLNDVAKDNNGKCCTCTATANQDIVSEEQNAAAPEEKKLDNDPVSIKINQIEEPACDPTFQIFSQDFATQSLEESFINKSKTCERAVSPVFGSKKGKIRVPFSPVNSPNVSQGSVVILNDSISDTTQSILDITMGSTVNTTTTNTILSPAQLLPSPVSQAATKHTPKNVKKLGISTLHNVRTDVIIGSNKKLKQSKLFVRTDNKLTDLSYCDDIFSDKSKDRDPVTATCKPANTNCAETNNSWFEDSLILGSPEQVKVSSRIRQKGARRIKSAPTGPAKFNIDVGNMPNTKLIEKQKSTDNGIGNTDTDLTVFEPKLSSTQYSPLPFLSSTVNNLKNKEVNDSESNDETLFVENVIPISNRSQNSRSLDNSMKKKNLSLKKNLTGLKIPLAISKANDITELEIQLNRMDESSPRKREKLMRKKKNTSPTYAYKGSPVRKKEDRALLNGWSCLECQQYYDAIGLDKEELKIRKNQCSRHRSKFNEKHISQQDYWEPDFPSSYHSTIWSED